MTTAMRAVNAVVFTGGVGEHAPEAGVSTLVVAAREDLEIARQTRRALRTAPPAP